MRCEDIRAAMDDEAIDLPGGIREIVYTLNTSTCCRQNSTSSRSGFAKPCKSMPNCVGFARCQASSR